MATIQGKFVWFEHVTRDVAASQRFYGEVLGWKVQPFDMGGGESYPMIAAGGVPVGGWTADGADATARWDAYLSVIDVDATLAAVTKAGGQVLKPAFDVPNVSRMAQVADPTGAPFWVMQSKGNEEDLPSTPAGHFHWNELWTADAPRALAFYEEVFGFGHDEMDMGPMGLYRVLKTGETPRAGILPASGEQRWVPYVAVDDCDATTARATKLGAKVVIPPSDVPGIGRYAVLEDVQGARIAVMKPAQ
jgi:predicted enzyme related to lactoylglutathione lyase